LFFPYVFIQINNVVSRQRLQRSEEALRRLNEELEQRVEERTEELTETVVRLKEEMSDRQRARRPASSEEMLKFSLTAADIGAWDLDLQNHTTSRSLRHDQIFGYPDLLPEWTYEIFLEHVLPEDRLEVDRQIPGSH